MMDYLIASFTNGGIIMMPIVLCSVVIWSLFFDLFLLIKKENKNFRQHQLIFIELIENKEHLKEHKLKQIYKSIIHKTCDFLIKSVTKPETITRTVFENNIRMVKLDYFYPLYRKLKIIILLAITCPLLGLLGTVLGMVQTFSVLGLYGNSNPVILSDGIATAMITTKAGLIAAFPGMLLYAYLKNKLTNFEKQLDQIFNGANNYLEKKESWNDEF